MGGNGQVLDAILAQGMVGICVVRADGVVREANDRFLAITGHSRDALAAGVAAPRLPPPGQTAEQELVRQDGETIRVRASSAALEGGERIGFFLDLPVRAGGLREVERLGRLGTWRWDREADSYELSDEMYTIYGRTREEMDHTAAGFLGLMHPDDREMMQQEIAAAISGSRTSNVTFRILLPDGSARHVRATSDPIFENGRFVGLSGILQDVTERALVVEALRRSEERFRTVLDALSVGVVVCDRDARIIMANPAAAARDGGDPAALVGRSAVDPRWNAVHDDGTPFPADEQPIAVALRTRRPVRDVVIGVDAAGGARAWLLINAQPQLDASGEISLVVVSFLDITDRRTMQARLALADRMVSVGTLAAGVAHEINNPLSYVLANLAYVAHELDRRAADVPGAAALANALGEAREGAERVRNIVRDLRTFSRGDDDRRGPVDVKRVIDSAMTLVWNQIRHAARLTVDIGALPLVHAHESRLAQVFVNLLVNAAQAIGGGDAERNEIRIRGTADADGRVTVAVSDTGCGIPAQDLKRVFDPFFTTKPVGMGTGLGLSICQGIVSELGGEIAVESEVGKGTTFRVVLPALDSVRIAPERPAAESAPRRGRVLVIDDEPAIGNAIVRMLEDEHEVRFVSGGKQALELLASDAAWDAVLCDLLMPHMTGMELFARLTTTHPQIAAKTIFLTGGAFTPQARAFLERTPNRVVEKPFDFDRLRALVAVVVKGE